MVSAADLLRMPITYDIIVSDFGRDATIEYLRLVANAEKRLIKEILEKDGRVFFDEYRRLMFTAIADVTFFKELAISASEQRLGYLTEDILIGLGSSSMSNNFVDRVSLSVVQETLAAINRGHQRIRVMIPCNGLSVLAKKIENIICSVDELERIVGAYAPTISDVNKIVATPISVQTVPAAVMSHLAKAKTSLETLQLLVLGTRGVNGIYKSLIDSHSICIIPLTDRQYELIDEAIVASIGGDHDEIESCRTKLQEDLIKPYGLLSNVVVLEACTDFHLGVGLSSLGVFAEAMVADCYESLIS